MKKWNPDTNFIDRIESRWLKENVLDEPYGSSQDMTVGEVIKAIEDDTSEITPTIVEYIRNNFSLEQKLFDHDLTGQEVIDAMRQGTPYGIILYHTLYIHKDCCLKKDNH